MKIEIDLNINIPQLAALLASTAGAGVNAKAEAPKAAAPKATPKAETKAADPAPEPEADATTDASPSEDEGIATIDDVKEAAKAYNVKNGRDALAALIGDHGGSKGVTTIPEGNYQAFIDAANA